MTNCDDLREASRDEQLEAMELWFRENYEDPAERTPYESKEGGYIWIWGGPYDAETELRAQFEGIVPEDVIEELASKLDGECPDWSPTPKPGDYDEGLYEAVSSNSVARETLDSALRTIVSLLGIQVDAELGAAYRRMLYANAISALETYLSDTFINRVLADPELLQKYIDSEPTFADRKVPFKDVARAAQRLDQEARSELLDVVWHNIAKVIGMYRSVLAVKFGDISKIAAAIQRRHDIVHRNGRRKDGGMVEISESDVRELVGEINELGYRIELKLDFDLDEDAFGEADF